jgi:hypothetical protein
MPAEEWYMEVKKYSGKKATSAALLFGIWKLPPAQL